MQPGRGSAGAGRRSGLSGCQVARGHAATTATLP